MPRPDPAPAPTTPALAGTLVVALEQAVAAPFASSRLADAGARVIKIERPGGDFARRYDVVARGESAYFAWLNRGKESVVLDLKTEEDRQLLARLVARADVFLQNLSPGATARLGFGSTALRRRHPAIVTCDISGYGTSGPYAERRAYDLLVQAESGLASITGTADAPGRVGVSACDVATGMYAHAAILEALLARQTTGVGRHLEVSLFASMADWMTVPLLFYDYGREIWPRVGLAHATVVPYGVYPLGDGSDLLIGIQNEDEFERFATDILEQPELARDARFSSNAARASHRAELDPHIVAAFARLDRASAERRLTASRIAFGFVSTVAELSTHPQLERVSIPTPSGELRMPAPPVTIDACSDGGAATLGAVPALGEHTEAVRRELEE